MIPPLFGKQEVGIWRVQKRFPRYGLPIWSLWPTIRFLPSIVAEKNVTKNIFGWTEVKQYTPLRWSGGIIINVQEAVMVMIAWELNFQLHVQSVPIITKVVSSNPVHGKVYSIQLYVIKFVSDFWQIGGFLWVLQFPPPTKLTTTIYHDMLKVVLNTINI